MPTITRRGSVKMEQSKTNLLSALEQPEVVERFGLIFEPLLKSHLDPISSKLNDTIKSLTQMVATLKEEVKNRDQTIQVLQGEVSQLHTRLDDLEQHGRRDSIRIFGLPEEAPGTTNEKVLKLVNGRMKLHPPLALEEISVSHRVGQQTDDGGNQDDTRPRPRPLLVKFTSRRSKERVMTARKSLRLPNADQVPEDHDEPQNNDNEDDDIPFNGIPIYLSDDLTKARAKLAYEARVTKRKGLIKGTWVTNGKIIVMDLSNHIKEVKCLNDLEKMKSRR